MTPPYKMPTAHGTFLPGMALGLPALPTGRYWCAPGGATTSITRPNGALWLTPMVVQHPIAVAALIYEFTVAGSSGAVTRTGIYLPDANYLPGTVLVDCGTDATTGTPAVREVTVPGGVQYLDAGLYFLCAVLQGTPGTLPTYRITNGSPNYGVTDTTGSAVLLGQEAGYQVNGITGALTDLSAATRTGSSALIRVGVKGA